MQSEIVLFFRNHWFEIGIAIIIICLFLLYQLYSSSTVVTESIPIETEKKHSANVPKKKKIRQMPSHGGDARSINKPDHQLFVTSLKGHTNDIIDISFSSNNKYLVSTAIDRTVLLWPWKLLHGKMRSHRFSLGLVDPLCINWSSDTKALIIGNQKSLSFMKVTKKDEDLSVQPGYEIAEDIIGVGNDIFCGNMSSAGNYAFFVDSTACIYITDVKGTFQGKLNTGLKQLRRAAISTCGRYIGACGYSSEVPLYEVCFTRQNEFKCIRHALSLTGHRATVTYFDFALDAIHMATVSEDGTCRVWAIEAGSCSCINVIEIDKQISANSPLKCAISFNASCVLVYDNNDLAVYNAATCELDKFHQGYFAEDSLHLATFDNTGRHVVMVGNKLMHVLRCPTQFKGHIKSLQKKIDVECSSTNRERLQFQLKDIESQYAQFQASIK